MSLGDLGPGPVSSMCAGCGGVDLEACGIEVSGYRVGAWALRWLLSADITS